MEPKTKKIVIILVIVAVLTAIALSIYFINKKKREQQQSENTLRGNVLQMDNGENGLETNPGTGNPASAGNYIIQIGDNVFNRGTSTLRAYSSPGAFSSNDSTARIDFSVNEFVGSITEIRPDGIVRINSAKSGFAGRRDYYIPAGTANKLGL